MQYSKSERKRKRKRKKDFAVFKNLISSALNPQVEKPVMLAGSGLSYMTTRLISSVYTTLGKNLSPLNIKGMSLYSKQRQTIKDYLYS